MQGLGQIVLGRRGRRIQLFQGLGQGLLGFLHAGQQGLRFFKGGGKGLDAAFQRLTGQGGVELFQDARRGMRHLFQRQTGHGTLQGIDGRGQGGDLPVRHGRTEIGGRIGQKVQLHAVLAGDEALELQAGAQAVLDQAAQDLLPEIVRELAGDSGPDDAVLVQPDVDRDGDAGVARVGLQADARHLAHGHAAEDHGRPDIEAAHRAVEVQDVFDVVTEHAAAAQKDARHQQRQSADDESPYSGFE